MVLIADGKRYNSIDEYMEDREKKGIKVTVSLYDAINEKECGTATAVLEETAVLSQSNLLLPEGYSLYSTKDSSIVNPTVIIENGRATDYSEKMATKILSEPEVTTIADVKMGDCEATAWGCDLTHEYVSINADYRS